MKTISISEFQTLVARNDWQREQDYEVVKRSERQFEDWDEGEDCFEILEITYACGWASKISTLGAIKITYTEIFHYDEYDPCSLVTETAGLKNCMLRQVSTAR